MATRLLYGDEVWPAIKALAEGARMAYVAVAYLGVDAREQLPLPSGSLLVTDASEGSVKAGRTSPFELEKYADDGVQVRRIGGLHAKVFVFDDWAVIGSANISRTSEEDLLEAVVVTDNCRLVSSARRFVRTHRGELLTPGELLRLQGLYQRPKPVRRSAGQSRGPKRYPPSWVLSTILGKWEDETWEAYYRGHDAAAEELIDPERYQVDGIEWSGRLVDEIKPGHQVIVIRNTGSRACVFPPARVLRTSIVRQPKGTRKRKMKVLFLEKDTAGNALSWTRFSHEANSRGIGYLKRSSKRGIHTDNQIEKLNHLFEDIVE